MTLSVTIVVGNPKPLSRTREVAEKLVEKLFVAGSYELEVIDLADYATELFDWGSETVTAFTKKVAASDLLVVASPTYKATYTGMTKAFLDRYGSNGLRGVAAIPVMTGADTTHYLGANVSLAPLLTELGAIVLGKGFYYVTGPDDMDEKAEAAAAEYAATFESLRALTAKARVIEANSPT